MSARIRPGHQVRVLQLSPAGALVETERRLSPGAAVEWYVETDAGRHATRALVVRCYVCAVAPDSLLFRGALELERPVPWLPRTAASPSAPALR